MKLVNADLKYLLLIFLISFVLVFDLFSNSGRSANGDGLIHTVVPTLFSKSLIEGIFPVGWTNGFANYGLPLGTVSQQVTTYLTAGIIIFSHNPTFGFNSVVFLGALLSSMFFYFFLRMYFSPFYSFAGVFLFTFTPYRILNIYIRGALPEFFAGVFFPLLLICVYICIVKKNIYGLFLFIVSFSLLTLTHPFMDIVALFLLIPYIIFLILSSSFSVTAFVRNFVTYVVIFVLAMVVSILTGAYYIFPLTLEIKYFYYGLASNHLTPNNYLGVINFFTYQYPYFSKLDIFNRAFTVNVGVIETLLVIVGCAFLLYRLATRKFLRDLSIIDYAVLTALVFIFMMTGLSNILYSRISLLSDIQFPWRMLSGFIFLPPIILSFFLSKIDKRIVAYLLIFIIAFFAFPQLYGKNYINYPYSFYTFTPYNLDAVVMNTIWTGNTETYPITSTQASIVEGKGKITSQKITDNQRVYTITAQSQIRMVDHTFYFPGWKVFVDGVATTIEYQNPDYRGVITYLVPPGQHAVVVTYTDTKIRYIGKAISVIFIVATFLLFFFRKRLQNLLV